MNDSNTAPGVKGGGQCQRESRDRGGDPSRRSACGPGWRGDITSFIEYTCAVCVCSAGGQPGPQGPADPGPGEHGGRAGDHLRCPDHARPPHPGGAAETSGV